MRPILGCMYVPANSVHLDLFFRAIFLQQVLPEGEGAMGCSLLAAPSMNIASAGAQLGGWLFLSVLTHHLSYNFFGANTFVSAHDAYGYRIYH